MVVEAGGKLPIGWSVQQMSTAFRAANVAATICPVAKCTYVCVCIYMGVWYVVAWLVNPFRCSLRFSLLQIFGWWFFLCRKFYCSFFVFYVRVCVLVCRTFHFSFLLNFIFTVNSSRLGYEPAPTTTAPPPLTPLSGKSIKNRLCSQRIRMRVGETQVPDSRGGEVKRTQQILICFGIINTRMHRKILLDSQPALRKRTKHSCVAEYLYDGIFVWRKLACARTKDWSPLRRFEFLISEILWELLKFYNWNAQRQLFTRKFCESRGSILTHEAVRIYYFQQFSKEVL